MGGYRKNLTRPHQTLPTWCPTGEPHWWVIDPPRGPVSGAWCRRCGRKRMFRNHFDLGWAEDGLLGVSLSEIALSNSRRNE